MTLEEHLSSLEYRSLSWSLHLLEHMTSHHKKTFLIWWDPRAKFDWELGSCYLVKYCSEYLEEWFDPDFFNWKDCSTLLCLNCKDKFEYWWNPDKFNWKDCSWILASHCPEYIHLWYDPERFNWEDAIAVHYLLVILREYEPKISKRALNDWFTRHLIKQIIKRGN